MPYDWARSVVVYALSDTDFLPTVEPPRGSDPERLDGLAFSMPAGPEGEQVASTRIALHPRMLERAGLERDRLLRHELTHVAVGDRADDVPLWLSEGIAEYVSVRPLATEDRRVPRQAVREAEQGLITELPDDLTFSGDDYAVHYAVSWWACEFLATPSATAGLWALLDQLAVPGSTEADAAARPESVTGINTRTLARKAAKLIVATYAPAPHRACDRSASPGHRLRT